MSGKFLARASALSLAVLLAACGGDENSTPIVNVNTDNTPETDGGDGGDDSGPNTGEPGDNTDGDTGGDTNTVLSLLGTGKGNGFNQGQLFLTPPTIQADGIHQFDITLADPETKQPWVKSGQSVSYTSPCIDAGIASIEGPTSPDSGIIKATYQSSGCYGDDLIHAFVEDSSEPAASGTVTIEPPALLELALGDYDAGTGTIGSVNKIKSSSTSLSKNGQARLTVGIVDINDGNSLQNGIPFTVNFESICADGLNKSSFEPASVTTTNGIAETIFEAGECTESPQKITATVEDADEISVATTDILVDSTQAFQMIAALPDPMSIAPSFFSTEGRETVSTVKFTLQDQHGDTGSGTNFKDVTFTINTANTAEFVEPGSGNIANAVTVKTDNEGVATIQVRAKEGVDHEEFRVIATYGDLITYSKPIVVNSMLPYEPKFSLSSQNFAPNTQGINGVQSGLTLYVADINGNRIRGNTYVNFQTDQGSIDPDCVVTDGRCNVSWESLETNGAYATITASTNGRLLSGDTGTIESSVTLLMSTNRNVFLDLVRRGGTDISGTEYCATAWVQLPGQGTTKFSPPVGTTIDFSVETGELVKGAPSSKPIVSVGNLVLDSDGYEFCTKVKPELDDTVTPNTYTIELSATVQTPDGGASETELESDFWQ